MVQGNAKPETKEGLPANEIFLSRRHEDEIDHGSGEDRGAVKKNTERVIITETRAPRFLMRDERGPRESGRTVWVTLDPET